MSESKTNRKNRPVIVRAPHPPIRLDQAFEDPDAILAMVPRYRALLASYALRRSCKRAQSDGRRRSVFGRALVPRRLGGG